MHAVRQTKDQYTINLLTVVSERDKAIQERNQALAEKRAALAERDLAILQRDNAIAQRDNALMERNEAIATLELARANTANATGSQSCCCNRNNIHIVDACPISSVPLNIVKECKVKRTRRGGMDTCSSNRKNKRATGADGLDRVTIRKDDWQVEELGLNQVEYDETTMPVPGCSCTGQFHQCYKWGSGGWQSSCCTTTVSIYPLPVLPNKRHARVGGRKMSGNVFIKLLSKLAADGYDLSKPVDLKDHWAKHGTNRYITIK